MYLVCREEFFDRRNPYGNGDRDYEDNADRFIFFCKAVVETMRLADLGADIVHTPRLAGGADAPPACATPSGASG